MIKISTTIINADSYTLSPSELTIGTCGSFGTSYLDIRFGDGWQELTKKVSFYLESDGDPDTAVVVFLSDGERCRVPDEIMCAPGDYNFVVSGENGTETLISLVGKLRVLSTFSPALTPGSIPTESEIAQIYRILNTVLSAVSSMPVFASLLDYAAITVLHGESNAKYPSLDLKEGKLYRITFGNDRSQTTAIAHASGDDVILELGEFDVVDSPLDNSWRMIFDDTHFTTSGFYIGIEEATYAVPRAASALLGGVMAYPKTASDTIPVHIDADGYLWCAPAAPEEDEDGDEDGDEGGDEDEGGGDPEPDPESEPEVI